MKFDISGDDVKLPDHTFTDAEDGKFEVSVKFKTEGEKKITVTSGKLSAPKTITVKKAASKPAEPTPKTPPKS